MTPHSLYGYEVESEFPLRRLLPVPGPRGVVVLRRASGSLAPASGTVVHALVSPDGSFTLTRVGDRLHVDCSATGEFVVDREGLLLAAPSACDGDLWEHRAVTVAVPLLLAERGELMLHGAAVDAGGRALVLVGTTGRGKSTAAFAAGSLGYPLLGEDCAAVDLSENLVWPGPLGIRLGPETETGAKQTLFLGAHVHALEPVPLGAVVVLGERGVRLTLERIDPAAALPLVLPHLVYGGSDRLAVAFAHCARLVARAPVYRCNLPDGLDLLRGALEELLGRVSSAEAPLPG